MGRWTYYSPSYLGAVLGIVLFLTYGDWLPQLGRWQYWFGLIGSALVAGLICQLLLIAAQGAFAQVLPVPGGRSIRGGGAILTGWLLIFTVVLGLAGGLLVIEVGGLPAGSIIALASASALAAIVTYIWNWPAAVRDFAEERRFA